MERLRCGTILMPGFLQHLADESARRSEAGVDEPVAVLEYVKCLEGPRAGQAFASLLWGRAGNGIDMEDWCLFRTNANVTLYLSPQTQQALRWKHVDFVDNQMVVPN